MIHFVLMLFLFTGIMLLCGVPVFWVARQRGLDDTVRRFLWAAGLLGFFCAVISAGSARLESQCRNAGNPNCFDAGGGGFQLVLVIGYAMVAALTAFHIFND